MHFDRRRSITFKLDCGCIPASVRTLSELSIVGDCSRIASTSSCSELNGGTLGVGVTCGLCDLCDEAVVFVCLACRGTSGARVLGCRGSNLLRDRGCVSKKGGRAMGTALCTGGKLNGLPVSTGLAAAFL